jgi:hypothetical protein
VITDFSSVEKDKIDLRIIDAHQEAAGDQAFVFVGQAVFTGTARELRYSIEGGRVVVLGDVDGDAQADLILHVEGVASLAASDFFL